MKDEKHILVVFPHPDDEAFGPAGTLANFINCGTQVTYICLTLGEMGRNMGKPIFATRESLPKLRKKELLDACKVIGIKDLRLFGYRDKTIEFENFEEIVEKVRMVIAEVKPSLVITHYPGHGVHPDHDATGRIAVEAVRRTPKELRPTINAIAISNNREEKIGRPDIINEIEETLQTKIAAIKAHRSQTEAMFEGDVTTERLAKWLTKEEFWIYHINE